MSASSVLKHAVSLKQVAETVMAQALKAGATDAEAVAYEGEEFSALVRLGQVETLKESGSRAIGLRVFNGLRTASTSSSDLSRDGLEKLVEGDGQLPRLFRRVSALVLRLFRCAHCA